MGEATLTALLSNVALVFTAVMGYFKDVLDLFVTQPVLLVFLALTIVGIIIGFARSLAGR